MYEHERVDVCVCVCARARARAWGRYVPNNGKHPYGWRLGSTGNNGANFPFSSSILVGILYCRLVYIRTHILYIYIYIYLPHPTKNAPSQHTCMLHTQSPTSCPTNQDLSLLPTVTDATRARAPVYPTCSRDGWCIIFVVHVILHIHTFICFFT